MGSHTFIQEFPELAIEDEIGGGDVITSSSVLVPKQFVHVVLNEDYATAIQTKAAERGFSHLSASNQLPTVPVFTQSYSTTATTIAALASWTPPSITANYDPGITLLTGASAADLNDLAGKCAELKDEIVRLRAEIVTLKGNVNALVDINQAYGMAT